VFATSREDVLTQIPSRGALYANLNAASGRFRLAQDQMSAIAPAYDRRQDLEFRSACPIEGDDVRVERSASWQ
jgi:hypothetical protein